MKPKRKLGSDTYITAMRRKLNISSRAINRIVSEKQARTDEDIVVNATFVGEVNDKCAASNLSDESISNADQSGFQYEMIRNRILAFKGEKVVEARVTASNAVSHSYSVQVHMSKAGKLGQRMFICFQEQTGTTFGPRVQEDIHDLLTVCSNVAVACSKSGKFTKTLIRQWLDEIFLSDVNGNAVLILDAWKGQGPSAEMNAANVSIEYIPEGATKHVQPLDVFFSASIRYWSKT